MEIRIVDCGSNCRYKLSTPNGSCFGRKYDKDAEVVDIVFPKREIELGSTCFAIIETLEHEVIDHIEILNNQLLIRTNVSQYDSVYVGFNFVRPDTSRKESDYEEFVFGKALDPDRSVPITPQQEVDIDTLRANAFADIQPTGQAGEYAFYNINGVLRETITFEATGDVVSVNGKTGEVVLNAEDVGALPDTTFIPTKAEDIDAQPTLTETQLSAVNSGIDATKLQGINTSINELQDGLDTANTNINTALAGVQENAQAIQELDTDLDQLTNDVNDLENTVADIEDNLSTETTNRTNADTELQRQITANSQAIQGKQDTLTAGENITIINNVISSTASGGTTDYTALTNKPKINNVELIGNKSLQDLGVQPSGDYATQTDLEGVQTDLETQITEKTTVTLDDVDYSVQQAVDKIYVDKQNVLSDTDKYNIVKNGLVNNTNVLSDEEKLKIETWLGLSETYLTMTNEMPYQVSGNYNPAHKKYVDEETKKLDDKIKEIELFKFPNMTIIGTPTINQGQVSDFTMDDYLEFPFLVDFRGRPFEINFAFTTGANVTTQQNILDSAFGLAMAIKNGRTLMAISYDGSTWANQYTGNLVIEPNTTYVYKISWNGIQYKVQYFNGAEYVNDFTFASTQQPYPKQMFIGRSILADNYFEGSVNLNYANLLVNGTIVWQGMDDAGLATRADVNLENITTVAEQKIKTLSATEQIEATTETELQPNKFYKFGEVDSLNLTFATETAGILNEYMFEFVSGETATTLILPDTVKFETTPNIEANKTYQISVVNNIGLIVGV